MYDSDVLRVAPERADDSGLGIFGDGNQMERPLGDMLKQNFVPCSVRLAVPLRVLEREQIVEGDDLPVVESGAGTPRIPE
jgi:hypothetical protein